MFAASTADWVMFAGVVAALGGVATAGYGWILREPPDNESSPELPAAAVDLPDAA